jgi:ribonuclease Z
MELVFLGTGGSWPTKERNVSCLAVRIPGEVVLFDCGEGTQRQLQFTTLSFMKIRKIFITHFHGDHFLGVPGLVQSMALNKRETALTIYGPAGVAKVMTDLLRLTRAHNEFEVFFEELADGSTVEFGEYRVEARAAEHHALTLAYKFEEKERPGRFNLEKAKELGIPEGPLYRRLQRGECIELDGRVIAPADVLGKPRPGRKLVYANDTRPCENVLRLARGCDVLVHDGTYDSSKAEKAWQFGHSTAAQAAKLAKMARARLLFLVHISPRYKDTKQLEAEARAVFENAFVATDFLTHEIRARE